MSKFREVNPETCPNSFEFEAEYLEIEDNRRLVPLIESYTSLRLLLLKMLRDIEKKELTLYSLTFSENVKLLLKHLKETKPQNN